MYNDRILVAIELAFTVLMKNKKFRKFYMHYNRENSSMSRSTRSFYGKLKRGLRCAGTRLQRCLQTCCCACCPREAVSPAADGQHRTPERHAKQAWTEPAALVSEAHSEAAAPIERQGSFTESSIQPIAARGRVSARGPPPGSLKMPMWGPDADDAIPERGTAPEPTGNSTQLNSTQLNPCDIAILGGAV